MVCHMQLSPSLWDIRTSLPHFPSSTLQRIATCWAIEKVLVNNYECPVVPALFMSLFI